MENNKGISKKIVIICIVIVLLVVSIVVGTFVINNARPVDVIEETLDGGEISLTYTDDENLFVIENAIPTSDMVGTTLDSAELFFDFTVRTVLEEANYVEYEVLLVKDEAISTAANQNIKVYLEKEKSGAYSKVIEPMVFETNIENKEFGTSVMSVYKQKKTTNGNDNYRLRLWVSDTAVFSEGEVQNFGVKVAIKGVAK